MAFVFSVVILLSNTDAMNATFDEFYKVFQQNLETVGIDRKMSQCVIDELRRNHVADTLGNVTVSEALLALESQIEEAASKCLPPDYYTDQPFQRFRPSQPSLSTNAPEADHSFAPSPQSMILLSLGVVVLIMAKFIIGYAIYSRRIAQRTPSDDEPLLR